MYTAMNKPRSTLAPSRARATINSPLRVAGFHCVAACSRLWMPSTAWPMKRGIMSCASAAPTVPSMPINRRTRNRIAMRVMRASTPAPVRVSTNG